MASVFSSICRLCMEFSNNNLFNRNYETNICTKILSCLDIKLYPEDGLPTNICEVCEELISKFYDFKEKCTKIDAKLRLMKSSITEDIQENKDTEVSVVECNISSECLNIDDFFKNNIKKIFKKEATSFHDKKKTNKILQCEFCGQIFNRLSDLKQHSVRHMRNKPYSCDICKKTFTRKNHQIVHMRTHSGERPFVCNTCGRASTRKQDLIRHMKVHSDLRNYPCLLCERRFKRSEDVKVHMRSHTGAKPFPCQVCEKRYSSYGALQKHYKTNCKSRFKIG